MALPSRKSHAPRSPLVIPARIAERASSFYEVEGECWISGYSIGSHGYAQIGWHESGGGRRATTAHRAAWVGARRRQIPEGMTIDHTCKNRQCVRPDHLRLLSNFENARRTSGRDWPLGQCVNGHPNAELILTDGGRRIRCRVCRGEYQRRYRAKQKARL